MHHRHPSPHKFHVSVLPVQFSRFQIPSSSSSTFLSHALFHMPIFLLPGVTHKKAGWVRLAQILYRPWYRVVDDESTKEYMQSIHEIHTSASCHIHAHPGITNTRRACRASSSSSARYFPPCSLWRGRRRDVPAAERRYPRTCMRTYSNFRAVQRTAA
jgi:hypothetical protein